MDRRPVTIFCDIDGTLVLHEKPDIISHPKHGMTLLEGTISKLIEWDKLGYRVILTTGRKESMRKETERQLAECGIFYDKLIMGLGGGKRVLINDRKPNGTEDYAIAINIKRNSGIGDIKI